MDPYREKIERLGFQLTVDNVAAFARQAADETERAKVEQLVAIFARKAKDAFNDKQLRLAGTFEALGHEIQQQSSVVPPREEP